MNRVCKAAMCVVLLSTPAMAADIGRPLHRPPLVDDRVHDWSGPYLGAHIGYDWGRAGVIDNGVLTEASVPMKGIVGGLLAGVNWQAGLFVYGVEADFGFQRFARQRYGSDAAACADAARERLQG